MGEVIVDKSKHGSNILSTHTPFVPCQSTILSMRYDFFKIWTWKSKVKVMGEVSAESHNMGPTYYRLTYLLLHVNRPSDFWDTVFLYLTFKIQSQGHGWGQSWKSQSWCNILSTQIHSVPCLSALPLLGYIHLRLLYVYTKRVVVSHKP